MSYNNPGFPTQRTAFPHVDNGEQQQVDLNYVRDQADLIRRQNQPYRGHIPNYIHPTPNDNIIQQTRYTIDPKSTHYNPNALDNTRNQGGKSNEELAASEIFTGPNSKYNPYLDFLKKKGLLNDNYKTRVQSTYINIDSRARRIEPEITKEDDIELSTDILYYSTQAVSVISSARINLLNITLPNHDFEKGDRVTLTGVSSEVTSIKSLYQIDASNVGYSVIFEAGKRGLIIKTDFENSVVYSTTNQQYSIVDSTDEIKNSFESTDPNFRVGDGISFVDLRNYNTSDMFVTLSGFTGSFIGNIPTNFLNATHRIYFISPDGTNNVYINVPNGRGIVEKITGFYIELPNEFKTDNPSGEPLPFSVYSDMVIDIAYQYIGGIAINFLNADIPISNNNIKAFHTVLSTTKDVITIELEKDTYYIDPTPPDKPETGQVPVRFGVIVFGRRCSLPLDLLILVSSVLAFSLAQVVVPLALSLY